MACKKTDNLEPSDYIRELASEQVKGNYDYKEVEKNFRATMNQKLGLFIILSVNFGQVISQRVKKCQKVIQSFREGNTRTIAVFGIKYLRNLGFDVDNIAFKENSKYFRDALVLANARREQANDKYLKKFFENLLLEGKNELEVVNSFT